MGVAQPWDSRLNMFPFTLPNHPPKIIGVPSASLLGPPVPVYQFSGGFGTLRYSKKGTLILTSPLDLLRTTNPAGRIRHLGDVSS